MVAFTFVSGTDSNSSLLSALLSGGWQRREASIKALKFGPLDIVPRHKTAR